MPNSDGDSDSDDSRDIDDLSAAEAYCLEVFFLHRECGYRFNPHGQVGQLYRQQVEILWQGFMLYREFLDPMVDSSGDEGGFSQRNQAVMDELNRQSKESDTRSDPQRSLGR